MEFKQLFSHIKSLFLRVCLQCVFVTYHSVGGKKKKERGRMEEGGRGREGGSEGRMEEGGRGREGGRTEGGREGGREGEEGQLWMMVLGTRST